MRVLIVDDEPLGRTKLRTFLEGEDDCEVIAECGDGHSAVETITAVRPDLVFLDVQMPNLDGLEVVEAVGVTDMPVTVFVTAYDQFALQAFNAQALDYLLKPFDAERFRVALDRARIAVEQRRGTSYESRLRSLLEQASTGSTRPARFLVKTGSQYVFVRVDEIDWIEAADNYVTLHVGEQRYMLRETMTHMEQRLDPQRFLRIRHSAIVNIERIQSIRPWSGSEYQVLLRGGLTLLSSRRYKPRIRGLLDA